MRKFTLLLLGSVSLFALSQFQSSKVCQKCHPLIYKEHFSSQHRKASIFNDEVHKAVWDKHPLKQKERYSCAKCHTPNDEKLIGALKNNLPAMPVDNQAQQEGVSCVSCHNIKAIKQGVKSNTNSITTNKKILFSARESEKNQHDKKYETQKSMFGFVSGKSGSPFHEIDFSNELYYNGNVCMGCHSHKENAHKLQVCVTDMQGHKNNEKENCITCHMPKVKGSFSTMSESKTHRYHGFTGSIHKSKMLKKYVELHFEKTENGFSIGIENKANHALLLHPLRVGVLKVSLRRDAKTQELHKVQFLRVIGKDKKPTPPWIATEVLKNTQIQAKELRVIHFDTQLKKGDEIDVRLGQDIVNPKALKKLELEESFAAFKLLKEEIFYVK